MSARTVLITGASTGIGRATALHLDRLGWTVYAGVRKEADADVLRDAATARLVPVRLDVTDAPSIAAAADTIGAATGAAGLRGLVNNAGIAVAAPVEFLPLDQLRRQLEVNLVGQIAVTQAMLPLLRAARGRVVNMSSVGGRDAQIGVLLARFLPDRLRDELILRLSGQPRRTPPAAVLPATHPPTATSPR
jgi:NAD(P)-dependent dehydrogenase (short-subunit alcohol dehydrogenase family)